MNKAVTVLHCDRFCIIIANCPSPHTTHFKIRTIPITFRTAIVCVLSWLCVLAKPLGTHAKASLPCLPLPLHQTFPFPQPFQKNIHPSLHTTLPKKTQKIRHLSKQRILYIQFSALVKMVSGSKAIMF